MNNDARAVTTRRIDHLKRQFTHASKAHLREEVEIVFVDGDDFRIVAAQGFREASLGFLKRSVKDCNRNSLRAEERSGI